MIPKTLESNSIPIPPQLAGLLKQSLGRTGNGFDEAAFLQQLHYWSSHSQTTGWLIDGVKWIYNSLKAWLDQFPWMSEYSLRKAIANLKKLGLIQTAQHWRNQYQQVMFYRIDYEQLKAFGGNICDHIAHRSGSSDQLDVSTVHTSDPETTPETSFDRQQTSVVVSVEQGNDLEETSDHCPPVEEEAAIAGGGPFPAPSSGESPESLATEFPELIESVAQAVGQPPGSTLPVNLKQAIAQFPERVRGAIAYLKQQQQKRTIENPVGYLYAAIAFCGAWTFHRRRSCLMASLNGSTR